MSTSLQIDGVRTVHPPGHTHAHITHVRLAYTGGILTRETVIRDLRSASGYAYHTYVNGKYAKVIVAGCPHCGYGDYITTVPDWTKANNLLSLPRV
jgi:hypothetical protein